MDRALPDPLTREALTAAAGTVVAAEGPDVTDRVVTPWDAGTQWPPTPETPASVSMDTGAGPVSLLANGRVVSTGGGTDSREVSIDLADAYQSLDRPISWDALGDAMPALTEATIQRYVSLHAVAVTDRILRHCGWYATPPRLGYSVLSVPAMGTMWPEVGYVQTSTRKSSTGYPVMFTEPWGKGVSDVTATYMRAAEYTVKQRGRVEMTAIAGRLTGGTMNLFAETSTFRRYRLSWTDTTVALWVTNSAGAWVSVLTRPRVLGSFIYATVEYVTDTSVRCILRVDGSTVEATTAVHSDLTTRPLTSFTIDGDACGAGFQVGFPSTTGTLADWSRNAVIYDRAALPNALTVLPPVQGENCADLLRDQCAAQNATYWIDETGVLRWWDLARLEASTNVATLTSDDDIADEGFAWSHDLSSVKRSVTVDWREPLVEGGWRTNVDLWQGSGRTTDPTDSNNPFEEWINVPDDEVWIMPDLTLARVGGSGQDMTDFNYGFMSHYGGVVRVAEGSESWVQNHGSFIVTVERVTDASFKMYTTWTGSQQAYQRTTQGAESTTLWGMRRNFNLPIIRGKKKYSLGDQSFTAAQTGPATAPDHVIDAGWWIQNVTQAQITADYAAARVTVPQPVLSSVALVPVPGLQLGDMVTVTDTAVTHLTVRGVVVADSRSIDADMTMQHAIAIRPVSVSRNGITWAEWASVARPKTWAQWSTNQNSTWQQWGSDPLGKE